MLMFVHWLELLFGGTAGIFPRHSFYDNVFGVFTLAVRYTEIYRPGSVMSQYKNVELLGSNTKTDFS